VGHKEEWDLQFENAGLRCQIAELKEQLTAAKAKVWALEERIRERCPLHEESESD
jgi:uncharacterized protein (DUF2164 family)